MKSDSLKSLCPRLRGPANKLLVYRYVRDRERKNILFTFLKQVWEVVTPIFFPLSHKSQGLGLRDRLGAQNAIKRPRNKRPLSQGQAEIVKAWIHFILTFMRQFYGQASESYLEAICKWKTLPTLIYHINISGAYHRILVMKAGI